MSGALPPRGGTDVGAEELRSAIRERRARIGVVGCGYVGLPLGQAFADVGFSVTGIDNDPSRVEKLNAGHSHILDVPASQLRANVGSGRFRATSDYSAVRALDVVFIAVPTPFDRAKQPDLRFVVSAAESLAANMRPGQLFVLESTTFPGTTDEVMRPILERGGLRAGRDFFLAFSPERIDPGNQRYKIRNTSKVVGGVDPVSTALAVLTLEQIITEGEVHPVSTARAAELTKLLENTFRAVNIALVNELAMLCDRMSIDIWEVIDAAATKPYGFMPFYPGPGVGGHCIPVDPYYLSWKAREFDFHTKFIDLAAETNLAMPFYTVSRIRRLLDRAGKPLTGAKLLLIGASFKRDIDDARNSAAVRVMEILKAEGAEIRYHDPYVPRLLLSSTLFGHDSELKMSSVDLTVESVAAADCVVILVAHSSVNWKVVRSSAKLLFDAVNATNVKDRTDASERL